MSKVDAGDFGGHRYSGQPSVTIADLPKGQDAMVVTITTVDPNVQFQKRRRMVLTFDQFPGKVYWPNSTSVARLIKFLGDETASWLASDIALIRVQTQHATTGDAMDSLWVAPDDQQEALVAKLVKQAAKGRK